MKKYSLITMIFVFISFSILSCSDSEKRMAPLFNQTKVIIDIGLPAVHASVDNSIIDRILRFFTKDAFAQSAPPAAFSSVHVRVTGPDIGVIEQDFDPTGTISLNILAGSFRQFDVTAYVAAGDPSAALSFRGMAVANLPAGQTVSVPVVMALYETKIVLADDSTDTFTPGRIVSIDNFNIPNWTVLTEPMLQAAGYNGPDSSFKPYDISFDSRGRIYIANNFTTIGVIRIDNIIGTNLIQSTTTPVLRFGGSINPGIVTIAVDRIQNKVYFSNGTFIYQSDLDGTNSVLKTSTMTTPIRGIDVGNDGLLYVVAGNTLYKYNWQTNTILGQLNGLDTPFDVITRPPYVYVANLLNVSGRQILQLTVNTDNSFTINSFYGNRYTTAENKNPGMFYGAHRFAAIRNDGLFIADSTNPFVFPQLAKLVYLPNMTDTGWDTFGTTGTGSIQFYFFSGC
jgi:hypothetical protein